MAYRGKWMVAAMEARWAREDVEALVRAVEADIEARELGPSKRRTRPDGRQLVLDRHGWVHAIVGRENRRVTARTPDGQCWAPRVQAA